jgi:phage-related baseplate assembly protein
VYAACNAEDIRPDTDHVFVLAPEPVGISLSVTYWIERGRATQAARIRQAVEDAVRNWERWQRSALGRDVNPSELNHLMVAAGAKRTEIRSPAFAALNYKQVAVIAEREVLYGGLEDG